MGIFKGILTHQKISQEDFNRLMVMPAVSILTGRANWCLKIILSVSGKHGFLI